MQEMSTNYDSINLDPKGQELLLQTAKFGHYLSIIGFILVGIF